jgi:DNA repair protein RadD
MKARYYQTEAVDALWQWFWEHPNPAENPLIGLPTGTGKSLVIALMIKRMMAEFPRMRIMKLTHVKELIKQNEEKLLQIWPNAPFGIYSAGLGRKELPPPDLPIAGYQRQGRVTYAGIQSIYKLADEVGHVDIIAIDEAHLISDEEATRYAMFFAGLRKINPMLRFVGLSATLYRLGLGMLTDGKLFTHTAYDRTMREDFNKFIHEGYLSPLVPRCTKYKISDEGIGITGGEYNSKQQQIAVNKREITYAALSETMRQAGDRKRWLVFTTGIEHTDDVADMLEREFGVSCTRTHSGLSPAENDRNIADFKAGKYRAMVNANKLTTGFDCPEIDLIVILRLTRSPGLWVQMLGRGTRPVYAPGFDLEELEQRLAAILASCKQDCLVLDFAQNSMRIGPINDPVLPKMKGKGGGTAPIKICEQCDTFNHASVLHCSFCGFEFHRSVKFTAQAAATPLIAGSLKEPEPVPQVEPFEVDGVTYAINRKPGRLPTLRVTYQCGLRQFREWQSFEDANSYAAKLSREWWRNRYPYQPADHEAKLPLWTPNSVEQANQYAKFLKMPKRIFVIVNRKYPQVTKYEF